MDWRSRRWIGSAVLLALAAGCDDKRDVPVIPPTPPATQPSTAAASRPTTKDLLEGPRKPLLLGAFKLVMEVPTSWNLNAVGSATWLEGDAPHGEVRIQLAVQGAPLKAESITALEKKTREEALAHPDDLELVALRNIGGTAKKMERREIMRDLTVTREDGRKDHIDRVDWSVMVFVPEQQQFNLEVLNFSGLSLQQYQEDREFLERILRTLHYDAANGALQ